MKSSFDEMMRGQVSNVDQIVNDTVERQCLCVVVFVFRRIHDAELGRMTRFGRFGCKMYQPPHRRSHRENRNSSDPTALKSRELWLPPWTKRMVRERRGGYFDTKEHMAEGLPDVGDKKSVRVEENLLRHGKIGWDKLTLNKFCLLPEMGKNEIPSRIV